MRRWLQATLAERHYIGANLRFLAPGEFVGEVLAANVPEHYDARTIEPSRLVWRIYAVLQDSASRNSAPIAAALDRYLDGPDRALRAWSLAQALADAFTNTRRGGATGCSRGIAAPTATTGRRSSGAARRTASRTAQAIDRFLRTFDGIDTRRRRVDCRRASSRSRALTCRRTCCAS